VTREEIAAMVVRIEADTAPYRREVQKASQETTRLAQKLTRDSQSTEVFGKKIDELGTKMSNMAGQMRAMAAVESPFEFMKKGVGLAAEAEQMQISFGTMLRSAERGQQLTKDIQKFAADTPMTLSGLQQGANTLLQFGVAGNEIIPTLQKMGDVTGGVNDKFQRMVLGYGQMISSGRVMGEELNQMREAGFNPLMTLAEDAAKKFGGPVAEHMAVFQLRLADGTIKVQDIQQAFKIATSEGGQFFGLMEKQSKSFNGLMSTMGDDVDALRRTVGKSVIEVLHLKDGLKSVSDVAQDMTARFDKLNPIFKGVATVVALVAFGTGAVVIAWKVGALTIGIVVGVLKDMVVTSKWVIGGVRGMTVAQHLHNQATAAAIPPLRAMTVAQYNAAAAGAAAATNASRAALALKLAYVGVGVAVVAVVGAAVSGLVKLTSSTKAARDAVKDLKGETMRTYELGQDQLEIKNKQAKDAQARVDSLESPAEKREQYKREIDNLKKELVASESLLKQTEREFNATRESTSDFVIRFVEDIDPFSDDRANALYNNLKAGRDVARKQVEATRETIKNLEKNLKEIEPKIDAGAMKELGDANKKLVEDVHKSQESWFNYGDTTETVADRLLLVKMRSSEVTKTLVDELEALQKTAASRRHEAEQRKAVIDLMKQGVQAASEYAESLREENATMLLTTHQAKMYKLEKDRAFSSTGDHVGQMQPYLESLAKEHERLTKVKTLMDTGKSTTESVMTSTQKYEQQAKSLVDQLAAGAISQDTFNRALVEAQKAAAGANAEIQKLDGTMARSTEGRSRVRDYVQKLRDPAGLGAGGLEESNKRVVASYGFAPNAKETTGLLGQCRDYLKTMAGREPTIELAEAALSGR